MCVCFWMQPDGAESVASLHSSDGSSEKKAGGHHGEDFPTISVTRASVSSGIASTTHNLLYRLETTWVLMSSHSFTDTHGNISITESQFQDVSEATYHIRGDVRQPNITSTGWCKNTQAVKITSSPGRRCHVGTNYTINLHSSLSAAPLHVLNPHF